MSILLSIKLSFAHCPRVLEEIVRTLYSLHKMASRSVKTTRKELTLKERVDVVEYARKHPREGSRKLSEVFKCGRTQIQSIVKNREKFYKIFRQTSGPQESANENPT